MSVAKSGLEECYYSCDWTKVKASYMHMMVRKMAQEQKVVPVQYKTYEDAIRAIPRGVDKFVRVGAGAGMLCKYLDILPSKYKYSNIKPPSPPLVCNLAF